MEVSVPRSMAADSMPFGRVGIGCDSLSSAALQIKSQEPSLRGIFYKPPVSPGGGTSSSLILSRSVLHSANAPFRTHLPRARCTARLFLTLSLQSQTRQRKLLCPDSLLGPLALSSSRLGRESKLALLSLRSVGSVLRSVPSWTQTLSAFRSYLPAAYRVCFAPQSSAESSEPSSRQLLRR